MKSFKEFTTNCPPGYRFDKKLGYCVPKGKRHINYNVGARYLSDPDEEEKKNGNGNGNGESDGGGDGGGGE